MTTERRTTLADIVHEADCQTTLADIVHEADADCQPSHLYCDGQRCEDIAAAILADPRLVELLAGALLAVEASDARRGKTSTCGEAAATIIHSLGATK